MGESPSLWAKLKISFMDHESILPRLRMISADHPSVRRISLDMKWIIDANEVAKSARALAKFDDVDLSKGECKVENWLYGHSILVTAILHASTEGDTKLKSLQ